MPTKGMKFVNFFIIHHYLKFSELHKHIKTKNCQIVSKIPKKNILVSKHATYVYIILVINVAKLKYYMHKF